MIRFKNVTKKYETRAIFNQFNLEIKSNQITCILGESGVGKTTLLNMIAKLTNYEGSIELDGALSYIFQEPRLIPNLTVFNNLKFAVANATEEDIREMLSKLEIIDKINSYPATLSGGEAQRVSIARAFLLDAPIILMDEPFSSLDLSIKYKLINYFTSLWLQTKKTVVFVTHDIDEALLLANEILILKDGYISKRFTIEKNHPRKFDDSQDVRKKILQEFINFY